MTPSNRSNVTLSTLTSFDLEAAYRVFKKSIPDAFEKEGLGQLIDDIHQEIEYKKSLLHASLERTDSGIYFLLAKRDETVIGTISFGPCGEDVKACTHNQLDGVGELGGLYVLPEYQDQGVGSALIKAMATHLKEQGIEQFCLDSGFRRAQRRWTRKFGEPHTVVQDYWGPDSVHMVWLCRVNDYVDNVIGEV
ncbi:GNAT family N-acetyltransferase [Paenibacillus marinisediminis]